MILRKTQNIIINQESGKPSLNGLIELTKEKKQTEPQFKQIEKEVLRVLSGNWIFLFL